MKYIILKDLNRKDLRHRNTYRRSMASGEESTPPDPAIEVVDLNGPKEVSEAFDDPATEAIACSMLMKLIAPLDARASTQHGDSWGVQAVEAEQSNCTGRGATVAILDTGLMEGWDKHPAFSGMAPILRNFTDDASVDTNGHGTHCAGTIFGRDVTGTKIGIAPDAKALIAKVLDDDGRGSTDILFDAILWAAKQRASIISMSLGLDFPGMVTEMVENEFPVDLATSMALEVYRDNLRLLDGLMNMLTSGRGLLGVRPILVAASGNESRTDSDPRFRLAPSLPAAAQDVVSVGALGHSSGGRWKVASFSNGTPSIVAPGVDVLSACRNGGLVSMTGTSMACPHVAAVAALWWEWARREQPGRAPDHVVREQLLSKASLHNIDLPHEAGAGLVKAPKLSTR